MLKNEVVIEDYFDKESDERILCSKLVYSTGLVKLVIGGMLTNKISIALNKEKYDFLEVAHGDFSNLSIDKKASKQIKYLSISSERFNWEMFTHFKKLQALSIDSNLEDVLCFSNFPNLKYCSLIWDENYKNIFKLSNLESLELNDWQEDYSCIGELKSLKYFSSVSNKNITSITGLSKCKNLVALQLFHSPKLKDASDLAGLVGLKHLWLQKCSNLESIDFIESLDLEELGFFTGSMIRDIKPITSQINLRYLGFGEGTKLKNNDISSLMELHSLLLLKMPNSKSFSPRPSEIVKKIIKKHGKQTVSEYDYYQGQNMIDYMPHEIVKGPFSPNGVKFL